jgi:extracellular elastinolytic metalloproteinase
MRRWPQVLALVAIAALPASAFATHGKPTGDAGGPAAEHGFFDIRLGQDPARQSARLREGQASLRRALGSQAVVGADPRTGTPRVITGRNAFLTRPSRARARDIARTYLRRHPAVFGLDADDIDGLRVVREQRFSLGIRPVERVPTSRRPRRTSPSSTLRAR